MNRADMVEKAAGVLCREQSNGLCRIEERCGLCDCGGASQGYARQQAQVVVDAILPQVSTVAELEALPAGTKVIAKTGRVWWRSGRVWRCETGLVRQPSGLVDHGPLTVVWQP